MGWWHDFVNGKGDKKPVEKKLSESRKWVDFIKDKITNITYRGSISIDIDKDEKGKVIVLVSTGFEEGTRYCIERDGYPVKAEISAGDWDSSDITKRDGKTYIGRTNLSTIIVISDNEFREIVTHARNRCLELRVIETSDEVVDKKMERGKSSSATKTQTKKKSESDKEEPVKVKKMDTSSVDSILAELDLLVGMDNIKKEVRTLINVMQVNKMRQDAGLPVDNSSLHCVFTGNPGTGKTTIARILAKAYNALGILKTANLVETDREGLVAAYLGQTAIKTNQVIESALDGVLFIDEAYALKRTEDSGDRDSFGQEAIDTLVSRMENYRDRLVVIVAGYEKEMTHFIEANPGLKSRFNKYFSFPDYSAPELTEIFTRMCTAGSYTLDEPAHKTSAELFDGLVSNKDKTFGNGRLARNIFETSKEKQANRIIAIEEPTKEQLMEILPEDITYEASLSKSVKTVGFKTA